MLSASVFAKAKDNTFSANDKKCVIFLFEMLHKGLQALKHAFEYHRAGDFAVGSLWDDDGVLALNHVIGDDQTTAYRQTVHELSVVGP